ncbi:Mss4-like protein [Mycena alexandri]|uniref:Mss4-like protein n=1 Tax=Mycena alexandri TaxID=1745969 RepID=A0AAD6WQW8_9AGAR|nr:Mss4-like protein [Mycena alexandri]
MTSVSAADKSKPYIPLSSSACDGWSTEDEATATCYCGAVQLKFPTQGPDCRKITASMFASNFVVADTYLVHLRGRESLTTYSQSHTIGTGNSMTNYFCITCGILMYRVSSGFPDHSVLRIGTVDDFSLHETKLKPRVEQFVKDRVGWLHAAEGVVQVQGHNFGPNAV